MIKRTAQDEAVRSLVDLTNQKSPRTPTRMTIQSRDHRKSPRTPTRKVVERPQSEVPSCQSLHTPPGIAIQPPLKRKRGGQYAANQRNPRTPTRMTIQSRDHRKSSRTPTRRVVERPKSEEPSCQSLHTPPGIAMQSPLKQKRGGQYAANWRSPQTPPRMTMKSIDSRKSPRTPTRRVVERPQSEVPSCQSLHTQVVQ